MFPDQTQFDLLTEKLIDKQQELKYCIFLTENCLYLLWAHLDYYMLRAISVTPLQFNHSLNSTFDGKRNEKNYFDCFSMIFILNFSFSGISNSIDAGWKVTADDVSVLKKTLVQVFTETFSKQLIATTQDQASTDKSFVEALLRRIKHLIQFVPVK